MAQASAYGFFRSASDFRMADLSGDSSDVDVRGCNPMKRKWTNDIAASNRCFEEESIAAERACAARIAIVSEEEDVRGCDPRKLPTDRGHSVWDGESHNTDWSSADDGSNAASKCWKYSPGTATVWNDREQEWGPAWPMA